MKKTAVSVTVFLVFAAIGFWVGGYSSPEVRKNSPVSVQRTIPFQADDLVSGKPAFVHKLMFEETLPKEAISPLFWEKITERLIGPLPQPEGKYQVHYTRELATRLSTIRAIGQLEGFEQERFQFFSTLLEKRLPWLIQREALHQLLPLLQGREELRNRILAKVDSRTRGLAALPARELLLQIAEQK